MGVQQGKTVDIAEGLVVTRPSKIAGPGGHAKGGVSSANESESVLEGSRRCTVTTKSKVKDEDGCVVQATERKDCEEQETGYPVTSLSIEDKKTCCPTRLGSDDPHMDILDGDDMTGVCKADGSCAKGCKGCELQAVKVPKDAESGFEPPPPLAKKTRKM